MSLTTKRKNGYYWVSFKSKRIVNAGLLQNEIALYENGFWSVCGYECSVSEDDFLMIMCMVPESYDIRNQNARNFFIQFDSMKFTESEPDEYCRIVFEQIKHLIINDLLRTGYTYKMPNSPMPEINKLLSDTVLYPNHDSLMITFFGKGTIVIPYTEIKKYPL